MSVCKCGSGQQDHVRCANNRPLSILGAVRSQTKAFSHRRRIYLSRQRKRMP